MSNQGKPSAPLLDIDNLIKDHNLPEDALKTTGLDTDELCAIYEEHIGRFDDLENVASAVAGQLRRVNEVHSLKYRVKDPAHLIEKIVRKRLNEPDRLISLGNYKDEITDLIGIRALHIFKEDWGVIHDYAMSTWDMKGNPTANIREGDHRNWIDAYTEKGCEIKLHEAGYRSVHYLIQSQPTKTVYTVELQVRTLFEEGRGEVDHRIRYPYDLNNPILAPLLFIFNRLAGSADEVASYIVKLQSQLEEIEEDHQHVLEERDRQVAALQAKVERLAIEPDAKKELKESINSINSFDLAPSDQLQVSTAQGQKNTFHTTRDSTSLNAAGVARTSFLASSLAALGAQRRSHLDVLRMAQTPYLDAFRAVQRPSYLDTVRAAQEASPLNAIRDAARLANPSYLDVLRGTQSPYLDVLRAVQRPSYLDTVRAARDVSAIDRLRQVSSLAAPAPEATPAPEDSIE